MGRDGARYEMILPAFYPISSSRSVSTNGRILLEAGARILQYRNKDFFSRAAFEEAGRIADLCRQAGALFVINDRADVAKLLDAALHLGQDDLAPSDARKILAAARHHRILYAQRAAIARGRFRTCRLFGNWSDFRHTIQSKPRSGCGPRPVARFRRLTQKPLVAIGGITRDLAPQVFAAGADSVAVIGDLHSFAPSLRERAEEWIAISDDARARDGRSP